MKRLKIDAWLDGEVSDDFKEKKIVPIFFSHGLTACANFYTSIQRDLAKNGYIVFSLNHLDGSCLHTVDKDGKDKYHGVRPVPIEIYDLRVK